MTWLTTAALLLSLLSAGAAAASGVQPLLQAENVSVQEGQVCDLTETPNADAILSNKVRNIETVVKMLDTQADIVRQSLKDGIESDNDAISDIS